jgi:nitrite reductase/ring-hydroxylating ferredoxin subunit
MEGKMTAIEDATWHPVGHIEDFPVGGCTIVTLLGVEVGVFNLGNDALHAVQNHCPHRGAPVCEGGLLGGTMLPSGREELVRGLEGRVLKCPWHRWEFDVTTGRCLLPGERRRLAHYDAKLEDGRVLVNLRGRRQPGGAPG